MLLTIAKTQQSQVKSDRYSGEFDAAIALPPKTTEGEYWQGYLGYTIKTGNAPF
jgi:hypothetical protein